MAAATVKLGLPPIAERRGPRLVTRPGLYDFAYIRKNVPILEVARQLDIRCLPAGARWTMAHCFRPQNHQQGDRTPSLGFNVRKNKFQCFACDDRLGSNIDLVAAVLNISAEQAAAWIAERFHGLSVIARKPPRDPDFRAGVSQLRTLEDHIRAGLFHRLTDSQIRILGTLWAFRDSNNEVRLSYSEIMNHGRIGSRSTVKKALVRFEELGLMEVDRRWKLGTGRRAENRVIFTLEKEGPESTPWCTENDSQSPL